MAICFECLTFMNFVALIFYTAFLLNEAVKLPCMFSLRKTLKHKLLNLFNNLNLFNLFFRFKTVHRQKQF